MVGQARWSARDQGVRGYVSEQTKRDLDREANRRGISRSALIAEYCRRGLRQDREDELAAETDAARRLGDVLDAGIDEFEDIARQIQDLNARTGVYAVAAFELLKREHGEAAVREALQTGSRRLRDEGLPDTLTTRARPALTPQRARCATASGGVMAMAEFDHDTVAPTDYKRGDVARLASYAERERGAKLRDRHGREMDGADVERLIEKSDRHQMSRHIVISPENADRLDRDQLRRATKRTMRDVLGDRDGVDWAYTVHMEGGNRPHAHVVATGRAEQRGDPLWMGEEDLERLSDRAHERAREQERERSCALDRDRDREHDRDRKRGYDPW